MEYDCYDYYYVSESRLLNGICCKNTKKNPK